VRARLTVNFLEVGKSLPAKPSLGQAYRPSGADFSPWLMSCGLAGRGGTRVLQLFDLATENAALKRELTHRCEDDKARRLLLAAIHKTWTGRTCASGESCGAAARLDALLHAMPSSCRDGGEYD
jgi:hypothetical protein